MLGIGFWEMLIIAGLILIAVGPDRLPSMVKTVAKFYRQFRRTAEDLRASTGIDDLLRDEELKELAELRKQKLALLGAQPGKPGLKPAIDKPTLQKPAIDKPALDKPALDKPALDKPALDKPALDKPAVGAPVGKAAGGTAEPSPSKPGLSDDPGHAMLGAAIPRTRVGAVRGGLDDKERAREVPPEGVDVFEARRNEPEITEDELRLRKARIAAKNTGRSVEDILAEEAARTAREQTAGAS
jgi:Tat protein translocase TatB subunit